MREVIVLPATAHTNFPESIFIVFSQDGTLYEMPEFMSERESTAHGRLVTVDESPRVLLRGSLHDHAG